jgi:hypothetical protein
MDLLDLRSCEGIQIVRAEALLRMLEVPKN